MSRPETKRDEESNEAFEAFAMYRDMGVGRSQKAVADRLNKSTTIINRWATAYNWKKRAHSYDLELDRRKRLADLRAVEKMRYRQTMTALRMQATGLIELEKMLKNAQSKQERGELDEKTVIALIEKGAKLERINRGEPGEIVQANVGEGLDLSGLSVDELRQLRDLRAKVRARQLAEGNAIEADGESDDG